MNQTVFEKFPDVLQMLIAPNCYMYRLCLGIIWKGKNPNCLKLKGTNKSKQIL